MQKIAHTHLILEKLLDIEKWPNWPFCKGHSKAKWSKKFHFESESTPLTRESFNEMLAIAWPLISKKDTHLRSALKVSERLSLTAISCDRFVFFTLVFVHLVDNIANILSLSIIANCKV